MKNKIFMFSILAVIFIFFTNVYAMGQNSDNNNVKAIDQVKLQTQIQNNEQLRIDKNSETGMEIQTQQRLQDETAMGNQVQNQTKNQGEVNQIQNNQQQGIQNENLTTSTTQRRSQVANAVQEMLQVADRNSGIGPQVKVIAQAQNQNQEKLEASLKKVQNRNSFAKFLVGPNYREINNAKKILEQNKEQIKQLDKIKDNIIDQIDQQTLIEQIGSLEQVNLEIENSLGIEQKGFSLLGWMFRMFSR